MATVTYFTDRKSAVTPLEGIDTVKFRIDMGAPTTAPASSDVIELMDIPANMWIIEVYINVITAEGATCTADLGDGVDPNGYRDAINLNATGVNKSTGVHSGLTAYVLAEPHIGAVPYSSADTLDLTLDNNCSTAVFDVIVKYHYLRDTAE